MGVWNQFITGGTLLLGSSTLVKNVWAVNWDEMSRYRVDMNSYEQLALQTGLSLIAFRCFQLSFSYVWVEGTLTYGFVYFFLQHQNCDGLSEDSLSKICRQLGHPIHMLATFTTSSIAPITIFISHLFLVRFRAEFAEDPGSNMFYSALK